MQPSRYTSLLLGLALNHCPVLALAGCRAGCACRQEAAAPEAATFKIGLVTDVGAVNDRSFNQSAWEGVEQAAVELGLGEDDIKYIETQDAKDYADNMQQFIDAGFNVIVTVGAALGDATTRNRRQA